MDVALVCITAYLAGFLYADEFGLYEDDWWRIPVFAGTSLRQLLGWSDLTFMLGEQGRPLHDGLIYLLALVGWRLGGLHSIYLIGYAIFALNATAFYFLLRRIAPSRLFALSGALIFCLYPADTTRPFLTHALGVQPSLTFLLAACHCYLAGRRTLSYGLIIASLLCYETFFLAFLPIPLLAKTWDRRWVRTVLVHGLVLGAILLSVLAWRKATGEARASELGGSMLVTSARAMAIGPIVSLADFAWAPVLAVQRSGAGMLLSLAPWLVGAWAAYTWVLSKSDDGPPAFELGRVAWSGAAMLVLSYTLALTTDPLTMTGRETRVHAPGAIGASMLGACLIYAVVHKARRRALQRLALAGIGGALAAWLCVGLSVQHEYKRSWMLQRTFWTKFVRLSPRFSENSVFLIEPRNDSEVIRAFSWGTMFVLQNLFHTPPSWKYPPRAFMFKDSWRDRYCSGTELFEASGWIPQVSPEEVANYRAASISPRLIGKEKGELVVKPNVCSGDGPARLAASAANEFQLKPTIMYRLLIR